MFPHLHTKLPWDHLVKYISMSDKSAVNFLSGKCNKIHIINRKTEKLIKRSYIDENMVCRDDGCEHDKVIMVGKHKNSSVPSFDFKNNLNGTKIHGEKLYRSQESKNVLYFIEKFKETVWMFADGLIDKVNKIDKIPDHYLTEDYLDNKLKEYVGNNCSVYTEHNHIYALLDSDDDMDIKLIVHYHETGRWNVHKFINEWGTQCWGRYSNYIIIKLIHCYVYMNLLIATGYITQPEKFGNNIKSFLENMYYDGDFHGFVPNWRDKYFVQEHYDGPVSIKDVTKINELVKKIFRYIYSMFMLQRYFNMENNRNIGLDDRTSFVDEHDFSECLFFPVILHETIIYNGQSYKSLDNWTS